MNAAHPAPGHDRTPRPGRIHLVTLRTYARRPVFRDHAIAAQAAAALVDARHWTDARLMTWVLMPDHWLGLVQPDCDGALPRIVGRLKAECARGLVLRHPHIRPLWQNSFHDRATPVDDDPAAMARHIVDGPVRAGLADSADAYPYRSALPA